MYSVEILNSDLSLTQLWCNQNYMYVNNEYTIEHLNQIAVRVTFKNHDDYNKYCYRFRGKTDSAG